MSPDQHINNKIIELHRETGEPVPRSLLEQPKLYGGALEQPVITYTLNWLVEEGLIVEEVLVEPGGAEEVVMIPAEVPDVDGVEEQG